jgi:hypothetical protein
MTPDRAQRETRNRFDIGVMVAIAGLTVTLIGIAVKGGQFAGSMDERMRALEQQFAKVPAPVYITPGAASEIASLKARQDMDDKLRSELDARLARIESAQVQILTELRRR